MNDQGELRDTQAPTPADSASREAEHAASVGHLIEGALDQADLAASYAAYQRAVQFAPPPQMEPAPKTNYSTKTSFSAH